MHMNLNKLNLAELLLIRASISKNIFSTIKFYGEDAAELEELEALKKKIETIIDNSCGEVELKLKK